jgi:hypothetical protein
MTISLKAYQKIELVFSLHAPMVWKILGYLLKEKNNFKK